MQFLERVERNEHVDLDQFVFEHPECDRDELRLYLEAIVQVDGIAPTKSTFSGETEDEEIPAEVDSRYEVKGILGRGGMGIVFLVRDRDMGRQVALKVVRKFRAEERFRLQRLFLEEVLTSARLEHPNIVPVYDRGLTQDGRIYYTMRWVQGRTLAEILGALARGDAETTEAYGRMRLLQIFYQLSLAVAYAHAQGIAHLDLKPANVMIGQYGEVLTLDWGLARPIGDDTNASSEGIVGTPGYMSPEQIHAEPVAAASDVFALGAILREMMTLKKAIDGETQSDLIANTVLGQLSEPDLDRPIPPDLEAVIQRALAVATGDRYGNAQEVAEAVFAVIEGAEERERKRAQADAQVRRGRDLGGRFRRLRDHIADLRIALSKRTKEVMPHWDLARKEHVWTFQMRLERLERGAAERFARAVSAFESALLFDPDHVEARRELANLHWEEFLAAEGKRDYRAAAIHLQLVQRFDDGSLRHAIEGKGRLWLRVRAPRNASVTLREVEEHGPMLAAGHVIIAGQGNLSVEENLPMGRYTVEVTRPNLPAFEYPFRVTRMAVLSPFLVIDERADDNHLALVPAGTYELGGDPESMDNPRREVKLEEFLIGRLPVTCGEYLEFINDLVVSAPGTASLRLPRSVAGRPLWEREGTRYRLPRRKVFPFYFEPDLPVIGISWLDAQAYCEWLTERDERGRVFTLPTSEEWEAAARGADERLFPWGDRYDPSLANNRDSQKGMSRVCSVSRFHTDKSPFGVRGMAGNVSDWCQDYGTRGNRQLRVVRGGNWNSSEDEACLTHVTSRRPDDISPSVGFRVRSTLPKSTGETT